VSERLLRDAFKVAVQEAGLKPIKMYNLRHSFGTTLAPNGVDIRTVQALMRHDRLSTTEQYMAYSPRPDLAVQIARALDPHNAPESVPPSRLMDHPEIATKFLGRLEEEIPAKWLHAAQRVYLDAIT
jgi:integrase-like protein